MGLSESRKPDDALSEPVLTTRGDDSAPANRLWWVVPIAVTSATMANVIFYFILTRWLGEPLLMVEQFPPPETAPMPVGEVIGFSIIWALGAALVYLFLKTATARPDRNFIAISAVVLLASFALPLKIPTPPVTMPAKLGLAAMHLIGALVVVPVLVVLGRRRGRSFGR